MGYKADGLIELAIPKEVEDTVLPDPYRLDYYKALSKRVLWLDAEIVSEDLDIIRKIIEWNQEDENIAKDARKPIYIYFNSPGGDLVTSLAIADTVHLSRTPVIGINIGECASGAALIYSCCHKRMAFPSSYFLLHLGSGGVGGTYQQTKSQINDYNHKVEQMKNYLFSNLTIDKVLFETLIDTEWYLYSDIEDEDSSANAKRFNLINSDLK